MSSLALDDTLAAALTFGPLLLTALAEGRRFRGDAPDRAGDRTYWAIQGWQIAGLLLAVVFARYVTAAQMPGSPWTWPIVGCLVGLAGLGLRAWSIRVLGAFFTRDLQVAPDHRLIDRGPYRVLRHPAYTGSLLIFAGIGLALGNWLSLLACLTLPAVGYLQRIPREEAVLRERLGGAYDEYAARTDRLIPGVW